MKKRNNLGFTMAELLIVVAIIGVLAGVSFVAVQSHQRSLAQSERNTIAKEIYYAAQNHLTMAESQGYLAGSQSVNVSFFGTQETAADRPSGVTVDDGASTIFYAIANGGSSFSSTPILDLMLPFGSIDDTVRIGGSYIIRYQANPAIVLDVFYCSKSGQPDSYNHQIQNSEYKTFLGYRSNVPNTGYVVGWYGGADVGVAGDYLKTPSVDVTNEEKLTVQVTDPNAGNANASLKLLIKGVSSGAEAAFNLHGTNKNARVTPVSASEYNVILDDITLQNIASASWHFADLNDTTLSGDYVQINGAFYPGEDIVVVAVSYSNSALTNIAYSNEVTTNSLFAELVEEDEVIETNPDTGEEEITKPKSTTAIISNIRHLENLDKALSGWADVALTDAKQIDDLDWNDFVTQMGGTVSVSKQGDGNKGAKENCYYPVDISDTFIYDGNSHSISKILVDNTGGIDSIAITNAGVFGSLTGATIKNLALIDTSITLTSGDAGALVGTMSGGRVENVVAYNSTNATTANVTASAGSAGGLVGSMSAGTELNKCAAALIVDASDGDAGGLVGTVGTGTACTVKGCYSGGHTIEKKKGTGISAEVIGVVYDSKSYNVTASDFAGGLIGDAGSTEINYSYSTCSASGATVGGLIGTGSGNITSSYCTGLVASTAETPVVGAFAATCGTTEDCHYFEIINEYADDTVGYDYLTAIAETGTGDGSKEGVTALDADASTYNDYTKVWSAAEPYLKTTLMKYYGEGTGENRVAKYNLKNIEQLIGGPNPLKEDEDDTTEYFVSTHYGDWPAPEIFVVNAAS